MEGDGFRGGGERAPVARIRLRAAPGAAKTQLVGRYGDGWKVRIAAAPEHGKANAELCTWLARLVGVSRRDVEVVSGAGGRDKLIAIHGLDPDKLARMLDAACGK